MRKAPAEYAGMYSCDYRRRAGFKAAILATDDMLAGDIAIKVMNDIRRTIKGGRPGRGPDGYD
ncbi:MAG: hypothetical protein ACLUGF_05660 [Clostridium sp.]